MTINTINHSSVCIDNQCKYSEELGLISSENYANAKTYHANLDLRMDYLSALQWCSARHMKLATINSVAENEQFINKTRLPCKFLDLKTKQKKKKWIFYFHAKYFYSDEVNYWIGLTQTHENNNVWFYSGKAPIFTNWDDGEPNNVILGGCGAASSTTGKWFVNDCFLKNHFACEMDSVVLTVYQFS